MLRTQDLSHAVKMWVRIPASTKNWREKMNQLIAEKISKIIFKKFRTNIIFLEM